jgi:hypothetical protein
MKYKFSRLRKQIIMWKKVGPTQNHRLEGVFEWIESGTHLVVIYLTVGIMKNLNTAQNLTGRVMVRFPTTAIKRSRAI